MSALIPAKPVIVPEECRNCRAFRAKATPYGEDQGLCRRDPMPQTVLANHWCMSFEPIIRTVPVPEKKR
jgi:hypothetical protein